MVTGFLLSARLFAKSRGKSTLHKGDTTSQAIKSSIHQWDACYGGLVMSSQHLTQTPNWQEAQGVEK